MIIPTDIDFLAFLGRQESQELHWADHFADRVEAAASGEEFVVGHALPWGKTHNTIRLRPSELTIWAGINGHRKSLLTGQVMLWLAKEARVCLASMEMPPVNTLLRMARQAAGSMPSARFAREFAEWGYERICIYDQLDTVAADKILGMVHYAAGELRCEHIVIDSLTKVGLPVEDLSLQTQFIDRLQWAAKNHGCHIHLVCHMRKGRDEEVRPNKFDIRGAGQIADLADNVFVLWKNKKRETLLVRQDKDAELTDREKEYLEKHTDQEIIVVKQRNAQYEGIVGLYFHNKSLQFTPQEREQAMVFEFTDPLPKVVTETDTEYTPGSDDG